MEELSGSHFRVWLFKRQSLNCCKTFPHSEADFNGIVIGSADIHVSPDGKFLYASNRGESNDIAIFSINAATGQLIPCRSSVHDG